MNNYKLDEILEKLEKFNTSITNLESEVYKIYLSRDKLSEMMANMTKILANIEERLADIEDKLEI